MASLTCLSVIQRELAGRDCGAREHVMGDHPFLALSGHWSNKDDADNKKNNHKH